MRILLNFFHPLFNLCHFKLSILVFLLACIKEEFDQFDRENCRILSCLLWVEYEDSKAGEFRGELMVILSQKEMKGGKYLYPQPQRT